MGLADLPDLPPLDSRPESGPVPKSMQGLIQGRIPVPRPRPFVAPQPRGVDALPDIDPMPTGVAALPEIDSLSPSVPVPEERKPVDSVQMGPGEIALKSFGRGVIGSSQAMVAGTSAVAPQVLGGVPLAQQPSLPEGPKDDVDTLLKTPLGEGWRHGKWWIAQTSHMMGGALPSTGLAAIGMAAGAASPLPGGTLLGGAAGFATGSALTTIVPAYQRAVAEGLTPDAAVERALLETGVAAAFGAAMGLAPGVSVFGRTNAAGEVASMMKRPILEALTQLGIVQPGLAAGQAAAMAGVEEKPVTPADLIEAGVLGAAAMVPFIGLHAAASRIGARLENRTASPGAIEQTYKETAGQPTEKTTVTVGPEGASIEDLSRPIDERGTWYSAVQRRIEEKGPASWPAWRWGKLLEGVEGGREEQEWLRLPSWLENAKGEVSKEDLVHYIEENRIQIEEKQYGDRVDSRGPGLYEDKTLPGPRANYREVLLKLPRVEGEKGFESSHFNDPNVLAHFRVTDRLDRDAKRTFHVEEIQSDWHQQGRQRGYRGSLEGEWKAEQTSKGPGEFDNRWVVKAPNGERTVTYGRTEADAIAKARDRFETSMVPEAPFKTSWDELAFKRILRMAADEGYERVTWTNGEQQILRYPGLDEKQKNGMREFYGSGANPGRLGNIVKKWANRLGMETGETRIDLGERPADVKPSWEVVGEDQYGPRHWDALHEPRAQVVRYVDMTPEVGERIRRGLPLFQEPIGVRLQEPVGEPLPAEKERLRPAARQVGKVIEKLAGEMGIKEPLRIVVQARVISQKTGKEVYGSQGDDAKGHYIRLGLGLQETAEGLWATASHEFGHFVQKVLFEKAPPEIKTVILEAHRKFLLERNPAETARDFLARRNNALSADTLRAMEDPTGFSYKMSTLPPERLSGYWYHFDEWFAEQTARWATTSAKPLNVVDRFFSSLGKAVRRAVVRFQQHFGMSPDPATVMKDWLDSHLKDSQPSAADVYADMDHRTRLDARDAMAREGAVDYPAVGQTAATGGARGGLRGLFGATMPPGARGTLAAMDKFGRFSEWMLSLPQIAARNLGNRGLQMYRELIQMVQLKRNNYWSRAHETMKAANALGRAQNDALAGLIEDHKALTYLTDEERKKGVERKPTLTEFEKMVRDNGVNDKGLALFRKVQGDFRFAWEEMRRVELQEANKITDPVSAAAKVEAINQRYAAAATRDYFPHMRYGDFTFTVRDAKGTVTFFKTFAGEKERARFVKEYTTKPGEKGDMGRLIPEMTPYVGVPPGFLDKIAEKLSLSDAARKQLDDLKYQYSPAESFKHRLQQKDRVPGWGTDFWRDYAHYHFHFANHLTRVEFADQLRDTVKGMIETGRRNAPIDPATGLPDHTTSDELGRYVGKHMEQFLDPKPDWALLRGMGSLFYLGYVPATAAMNLSQLPFNTLPMAMAHFGNVKGAAAVVRAAKGLATYYTKERLETATGGMQRALAEAHNEGVIEENLAPQMAGQAEGRNVITGFARNPAERLVQGVMSHAMDMFQLAEKVNRRITFRAGYELAMSDPTNKEVVKATEANRLQYRRLIEKGWNPTEAGAFTYAKQMTETTQFVYAPWARPKVMQGKIGSNVFLFKSFTQNQLFFLQNNPGAAWRSLAIMGAIGGAMGLPGVGDVSALVKGMSHLFGKDFDPEEWAREHLQQWFKGGGTPASPGAFRGGEGGIRPDIILHGTARVGYGLPQIAAQLNVPFPVFDRSRNIGMGKLLPLDEDKMLSPARDPNGMLLGQMQQLGGPVFGLGIAMGKALTDTQLDMSDFKRWESVMPSAARNASQAFRYWNEGQERNRRGNAIVRFDPRDTTQMMEILGRAAGYQPARKSYANDLIGAKAEAEAYWDLRREGLLRQAWAVRQTGDDEQWQRMLKSIREYNAQLPDEVRPKAITSEGLTQSFRNRALAQAKQEQGIPLRKGDVPLERKIQSLYPEAQPAGRRVVR